MMLGVHPLIALGVLASTGRDRCSLCLLQRGGERQASCHGREPQRHLVHAVAFAVISYTENAVYVLFAAVGSWLGAFASASWFRRGYSDDASVRHNPP